MRVSIPLSPFFISVGITLVIGGAPGAELRQRLASVHPADVALTAASPLEPETPAKIPGGTDRDDSLAARSLSVAGVAPLPADREVVVTLTLPGATDIVAEIIDLTGSIRGRSERFRRAPGGASLMLDISELPAGIYSVRLRTAFGSTSASLVVR